MSLTETLLFNKPVRLPNGQRLTHNMDSRRRYNARNAATKAANIDRVFNAIADGHDTVETILAAVGLSKSTVQKAINNLEDWPGGARIKRTTGRTHRFVVV